MKKNKNQAMKVMGGALAGAALGLAAGLFMTSQEGKKLRKTAGHQVAELYKMAAPQLKKMKHMSEADYKAAMRKATAAYSKARRLSTKEAKDLEKKAMASWSMVKKHMK
ncbi:MAG: hypothetical protein KGI60_04225 [Patescibacteria group bacterium]|nr:hypothetical protein [Patescibacteria group bacterium]